MSLAVALLLLAAPRETIGVYGGWGAFSDDSPRRCYAIAGVSGPLPEEGDAPPALLQTDALTALGMKFGGRARLEETVRELVSAVQGNPTTSTRAVNS